jgi:hypothetical protein
MFISSLFLISCSQNKLPTIKDPDSLKKDCSVLFQQFPLIINTNTQASSRFERIEREWLEANMYRDIPANDWPVSIQNLKPFAVHRSDFGIYIWIKTNNDAENPTENWFSKGYFALCKSNYSEDWNSTRRYNNFNPFAETSSSGIYEVTIPIQVE